MPFLITPMVKIHQKMNTPRSKLRGVKKCFALFDPLPAAGHSTLLPSLGQNVKLAFARFSFCSSLGKIRVLVMVTVISLSLLPLQTSAFFGFASTPEIRAFSLVAFVGEDFMSLTKTYEINNQKTNLSFFSESYLIANHNPEAPKKKVSANKEIWATITAYSSTKDQTDNTPFITALGTHVRDGVIAANFLPFGTVIKIPELYGDKILIVEDRMNSRYGHGRIDIWFPEKNIAKEFGVKRVKIEIIS